MLNYTILYWLAAFPSPPSASPASTGRPAPKQWPADCLAVRPPRRSKRDGRCS